MIDIIPAIDIIDGKCVRLSMGDYNRKSVYDASPVDMARRYVDSGMPRVHVVDLDGAKSSGPMNLHVLEQLAAIDGAQIEWGGGVKSDSAVSDVLSAGATYVVIGSVAANHPETFADWLDRYGSQRMVLGADTKDGRIAVNGWLESSTLSVDELIDTFVPHKLSQVICTDISRDGMLQGPSFDLYHTLQDKYHDIAITASGGISCLNDILRLNDLGVRRVIVGKAIYEGKISLAQIEKIL